MRLAILKQRFGKLKIAQRPMMGSGVQCDAGQSLKVLEVGVGPRNDQTIFDDSFRNAPITGASEAIALPPAAQHLSTDGRFHYVGGALPLPQPLAERAVRLGRRAVATLAGQRGYVGVDLVLGEPSDGSRDGVIEINPRLTTSYIGLRALARGNLAEAMLQAAGGGEVAMLSWRSGPVQFLADGTVVTVGR